MWLEIVPRLSSALDLVAVAEFSVARWHLRGISPGLITIPLCAESGKLPANLREVFSFWNEEVSGNVEWRGVDISWSEPLQFDSL